MLTGGGDCPGLNAVIRAIVRKGIDEYGHAIVGFRDGWRGPIESQYEELTIESVRGILPRGGTILGSSRTNPLKDERGAEGLEKILILAAVALPLLGLLIWFKDDLATWIKSIWGTEKERGDQKLYGDGGTYGGN